MIEYRVFIKNRFNELTCIGKATEFPNGCFFLQFDVVPKNGEVMLSPVQPKCEVVPLKSVLKT